MNPSIMQCAQMHIRPDNKVALLNTQTAWRARLDRDLWPYKACSSADNTECTGITTMIVRWCTLAGARMVGTDRTWVCMALEEAVNAAIVTLLLTCNLRGIRWTKLQGKRVRQSWPHKIGSDCNHVIQALMQYTLFSGFKFDLRNLIDFEFRFSFNFQGVLLRFQISSTCPLILCLLS